MAYNCASGLQSYLRNIIWLKLVLAGSLVSACGGSGGSGDDPQASELQQMRTATNQLLADFTPIEYTELAMVPTVGTATYNGFISGQLSNTEDDVTDTLIGQMTVEVDFEAVDIVTGTASGFLDDNGDQMTGMLTLMGGYLDRDGNPNVDATFLFEGTGELVDIDGQTLVLDTDFGGDFLGATGDGIGGDFAGQVTADGESQSIGGLFIGNLQ